MAVNILDLWRRVNKNRPFDPAEWNRLMNWFNGDLSAPFGLVDDTGTFGFGWNPGAPIVSFTAPVEFNGTVVVLGTFRLGNAIYLYGRNAANSADIGIVRVNASDIIELGPSATQRLTVVSPLTNNTAISARNAANSANVTLLGLNGSDVVTLGQAATRLSFLSSLLNATSLNGRNAANSADIALIGLTSGNVIQVGQAATSLTLVSPFSNNVGLFYRNAANSGDVYLTGLNASDQIVTGSGTTIHNLAGQTVVPAVDPPLSDGQLTSGSLIKAFAHVTVSGGAATLRNNQNVASVTRNVAGDYTVAWDRDFNSAFYGTTLTYEDNAVDLVCKVNSKAAGSADLRFFTLAGVLTDPDAFTVECMGTLV